MTSDGDTREFHVSPTKVQQGYLLAAVVAAIGVAVMLLTDASVANGKLIGLLLLVFGAGVFYTVRRSALDPRPRLVIDGRGIWYRDWGLDTVPWSQVADAHPSGSRFHTAVALELRQPEALLAGLSEKQRAKLRSNRLVRLPRLLLPEGALNAPLAEILELIEARLAEVRGRR